MTTPQTCFAIAPQYQVKQADWFDNEYNSRLAYFAARASLAVYDDDVRHDFATLMAEAQDGVSFSGVSAESLQNSTQYAIATATVDGKKIVLIAFRGTLEKVDWLTDATIHAVQFSEYYTAPENFCLTDDICVHSGFQLSLNAFRNYENSIQVNGLSLETLIAEQSINPDTRFIITGHSLGGALSTLYAARLLEAGIPKDNLVLYTFGAPAAGNIGFRARYDNAQTRGAHHHRIRNEYDPVPYSTNITWLLPDPGDDPDDSLSRNLVHTGKQRIYSKNGRQIPETNALYAVKSLFNFGEHGVKKYASNVKRDMLLSEFPWSCPDSSGLFNCSETDRLFWASIIDAYNTTSGTNPLSTLGEIGDWYMSEKDQHSDLVENGLPVSRVAAQTKALESLILLDSTGMFQEPELLNKVFELELTESAEAASLTDREGDDLFNLFVKTWVAMKALGSSSGSVNPGVLESSALRAILDESTQFFATMSKEVLAQEIEKFTKDMSLDVRIATGINYTAMAEEIDASRVSLLAGEPFPQKGIGFLKKIGTYGATTISTGVTGIQLYTMLSYPSMLYAKYSIDNIQAKRQILEALQFGIELEVYDDISNKLDLIEEQTRTAAWKMFWDSQNLREQAKSIYDALKLMGDVTKGGISAAQLISGNANLGKGFTKALGNVKLAKSMGALGVVFHQLDMMKDDTDFRMLGFASASSSSLSGYFAQSESKIDKFLANLLMVNSQKLFESQSWWTGSYKDLTALTGSLGIALDIVDAVTTEGLVGLVDNKATSRTWRSSQLTAINNIIDPLETITAFQLFWNRLMYLRMELLGTLKTYDQINLTDILPPSVNYLGSAAEATAIQDNDSIVQTFFYGLPDRAFVRFFDSDTQSTKLDIVENKRTAPYYWYTNLELTLPEHGPFDDIKSTTLPLGTEWEKAYLLDGKFVDPDSKQVNVLNPLFNPELSEKPILFFVINNDSNLDPVKYVDLRIPARGEIFSLPYEDIDQDQVIDTIPEINTITLAEVRKVLGANSTDDVIDPHKILTWLRDKRLSHHNFDFKQGTALDANRGWAFAIMQPGFMYDVYLGDSQNAYKIRLPLYTLIKDLLVSETDIEEKKRMVVALHTTVEELGELAHKKLWDYLIQSPAVSGLSFQYHPFADLSSAQMWDWQDVEVTAPAVQLAGISYSEPLEWEFNYSLQREYYDALFADLTISLPQYFLKQDGNASLPWPADGVSIKVTISGEGYYFVNGMRFENMQPNGSINLTVPILNQKALLTGSGSLGDYHITVSVVYPGMNFSANTGHDFSIQYDANDFPDLEPYIPYLEFQTTDASQFAFDVEKQSFSLMAGQQLCIQIKDQTDLIANWLENNQRSGFAYEIYTRFVQLDNDGNPIANDNGIVMAETILSDDGHYCFTIPDNVDGRFQFASFQIVEIGTIMPTRETINIFSDSQYCQVGLVSSEDSGDGEDLPDPGECTGTEIACEMGIHIVKNIQTNRSVDVAAIGDYLFVLDMYNGLEIYSITNSTQPSLVTTIDTDGYARNFDIAGDYAYIADSGGGIKIIDIASPSQPILISTFNWDNSSATDVSVIGDYAYITNYTDKFLVIDISNPALPTLAASLEGVNDAYGLDIKGNYAYVAQRDGLRVIDITNPEQPNLISLIDTEGFPLSVTVDGNYVYLADRTKGLKVFNIINPVQPNLVASVDTVWAKKTTIEGNYAFLADGYGGLKIFDITNPSQPILITALSVPDSSSISVAEGYAYVAGYDNGFQVVDVSALNKSTALASFDLVWLRTIKKEGNYIYAVGHDSRFYVIDISTPTQPTLIASLFDYQGINSASIDVSGNYAYVYNIWGEGLKVIDITNPAQPFLVTSIPTVTHAIDIEIAGNYAYLSSWDNGLQIVDITNPTQPVLVTNVEGGDRALGIAVDGSYAYIADEVKGLKVIDISNPTQPIFVANVSTFGSGKAQDITIAGNYAYLANDSYGVDIFDITDPLHPVSIAQYDNPLGSSTKSIAVNGNYAYLGNQGGGVEILDISVPSDPIFFANLDNTIGKLYFFEDIKVIDKYAYIIGNGESLDVVDLDNALFLYDYYNPTNSALFLSENLPDTSYLTSSALKTWSFRSGNTRISGLKAIQVTSDHGLDITMSEIFLGNVEANTEFTVELPITPSHDGAPVKTSVWKLVNSAGKDVQITNSASNTFWLKIRTNRAPEFTDMQFSSAGGRVDTAITVPVWAMDPDDDLLTFSVEGIGSISDGVYSGVFTEPGVHTVTLIASDGVESVRFNLNLVITGTTMDQLFSDVTPAMDSYGAIHNLARHGVVIGMPGELPGERIFLPSQEVRQADALKMVIEAARVRGLITIAQDYRLLSNLVWQTEYGQVSYRWLTPYLLTAEELGAVDDIDTFNPLLPATREWLAELICRVFNLSAPTSLFNPDAYSFPDQETFSSETAYQYALLTAFYGYVGILGDTFDSQGHLDRSQVAIIVDKILRTPTFTNLLYTPSNSVEIDGQNFSSFIDDLTFQVVGMLELDAPGFIIDGENRIMDNPNSAASRVRLALVSPDMELIGSRLSSELPDDPLAITANKLTGSPREVRELIVVIQDTESGARYLRQLPLVYLLPDNDGDLVRNEEDVFPDDVNEWTDNDHDTIGDNADLDDDNDGYLDTDDAYPLDSERWQKLDSDADGYFDDEDAFPYNPSEWIDIDYDLIGNNADLDDDNDGYLDVEDSFPNDPYEWLDSDNDLIGDNADLDDDNDKVEDNNDLCPGTSLGEIVDSTGCSTCQRDDDHDEIPNCYDNCPFVINPNQADTDGDGIGDSCDNNFPWNMFLPTIINNAQP